MERPNPETYMTEEACEQWRADLATYHRDLDNLQRQPRVQTTGRRGASIEVGIPLAVSSGKLP